MKRFILAADVVLATPVMLAHAADLSVLPSLDFSNPVWCIGVKNQRKILCHSNFSLILERADADRVYAAPVRI